jgi:hypothetical protein
MEKTTVQLDQECLKVIEEMQDEEQERTGERPSLSNIVRRKIKQK